MKMKIAKISFAVFLLLATAWIANVQSVRASDDDAAQKIEVVDVDQAKATLGVTCTPWSNAGSGSECTCYHDGKCIGTRQWDLQRRVCGLPGTSWGGYDYRKINVVTAGPSC